MILLKTSNCEIEWGYHIELGGSVTEMRFSPEYLCLKLYTQAVVLLIYDHQTFSCLQVISLDSVFLDYTLY